MENRTRHVRGAGCAPLVESLESRQLFAAAAPAALLPSLVSAGGGSVNVAHGKLSYTRIKGTYSGNYTRDGHTYHFVIKSTQFTHTGHFSGTITVSGVPVIGTVNGTFTGRIRTNRHFTVEFKGSGFTGTLVGVASHTGGHLTGTYTVKGLINSSGPFDVGK